MERSHAGDADEVNTLNEWPRLQQQMLEAFSTSQIKSNDAKEPFAIANSSSWDKAKFNESGYFHEAVGQGKNDDHS